MSWQTVALDKLCEINVGKTPSRANKNYWSNGTEPWLSIADMTKGFLVTETKERITKEAVASCNCKIALAGTVLMSFKLSVGKVSLATFPVYTNEAIAALPIKNKSILCEEYLAYALKNIDLQSSTDRAAMGLTLNKDKLKRVKIPLPPLTEQKRIAAILDKAAEIKAKRELVIAKLDELARSTFVEMFGEDKWRKVSIAEVTEKVQNCSPENKFIKEFTYIDIGAVDNINKKIINPRLLNKDDAPSRAKQLIEKDDVLVSTVRPNLNAVARVECEYLNAVASTGFCVLRCKQDLVLPAYIFAIVKSAKFVDEMIRLATGASYPAVNDKIISQYCIPLPPIAMQRTFTEKIKALQTYAATSVKHDEKLIGLTASLQHQAFTTGFAA